MTELEKLLRKQSKKARISTLAFLKAVQAGNFSQCNIKKLSGSKKLFRAKKGKIRIIFELEGKTVKILSIQERSEKTYKRFS